MRSALNKDRGHSNLYSGRAMGTRDARREFVAPGARERDGAVMDRTQRPRHEAAGVDLVDLTQTCEKSGAA